MIKKQLSTKKTALQFIREVVSHIEKIHPNREQMLHEVKMMNFKIRPVSGDIFKLAKQNNNLMESLWRIGKIEDVVMRAYDNLDRRELKTFFNYMDHLEAQMQYKIIGSVDDELDDVQKDLRSITMEVFRERPLKRNVN